MLKEVTIYADCREDLIKIAQIVGRGLKGALNEGNSQIFVELLGTTKSFIADVILAELDDTSNSYQVPERNCFSLEVGHDGCPAAWQILRTEFNSRGKPLKFGYTTLPFSSCDFVGLENAPEPYDSWGIKEQIHYQKDKNSNDASSEIILFGHKRRRSYELKPTEDESSFDEGRYDFIDLTISIGPNFHISIDTQQLAASASMQCALNHLENVQQYRRTRLSNLSQDFRIRQA